MRANLRTTLDSILVSIRERGFESNPAPYRCHCQDSGLIFVSEEGHGSARPCERCNQDAFKAWRNGCWSAGHRQASCDLCRPKSSRKDTFE